ncbi:MAG: penicillin-binding protein activator, partial [Alphaproteobacteria bacterium]|nr:penicillin-binding protein activator [Alphaproteobacteria bacterium]
MPRSVFPFAPRVMLVATVFALAACSEANLAVSLGFIQPAAVVDSPVTVLAPFLEEVAPVPAVPGVPGVLRVGLMIPLSGSAAGVGRDLLDAAQLALFDFTLDRFELRIYDTGSNPVIAASAAARAQQDGVRLLLGPLFSDAVSAAAGVMRPQAVPVYAFSNDRLV